jgi:hypothetical protein
MSARFDFDHGRCSVPLEEGSAGPRGKINTNISGVSGGAQMVRKGEKSNGWKVPMTDTYTHGSSLRSVLTLSLSLQLTLVLSRF